MQTLIERARRAGLELQGPKIQVENLEAALGHAARGLGATVLLRTVAEAATFPKLLKTVSFDPPYETFAFVSAVASRTHLPRSSWAALTEQQIRFGKPVLPPIAQREPAAPSRRRADRRAAVRAGLRNGPGSPSGRW